MPGSGYLVVLVTAGSSDEAQRIADALVSQRKAACVNIVPQVRSIFRWEGRTEREEETLLLVKTRTELFPEVVTVVKGIHSYEVPEIIAVPVAMGNMDYLEWLDKETGMK